MRRRRKPCFRDWAAGYAVRRAGKIAGLTFRGAKTMAAKLAQNKDVAYLSYKLATIKTDVELELTCEQLEVQQPIADELLGLFKNMSSSAGRRTSRQANGYRQRARNRRPNRRKRSLLMNRPANRQRRSLMKIMSRFWTTLRWKAGLKS